MMLANLTLLAWRVQEARTMLASHFLVFATLEVDTLEREKLEW
jgi:hypothetical protein